MMGRPHEGRDGPNGFQSADMNLSRIWASILSDSVPLQLASTKNGSLKQSVRDIMTLSMLPRPELCMETTTLFPRSDVPAQIPTASPHE